MASKAITLGGAALLLAAVVSPGATFVVAQRHPQADDDGPGSADRPWKTLNHAASRVAPGDVVRIRGGIYRERVVITNHGTASAPICFEALPGEPVVVTGADRLTGWERTDPDRPVYRVTWPHRFNTYSKTMTHPGDEYHRLIGRCEQVIVDGYLLRQVLEPQQLAPGTFQVDVTNGVLAVWGANNADLNRAEVEASVRQEILRVEGEHVHLRGLRFRYAANPAQRGAVALRGAHGVVERCVFEDMNSSGATFAAEDLTVRGCTFRGNGQLGFGANRAHHLRFSECLVEGNNTKNFHRGWEAGGNKLVLCRDAVLERSRFVRNHGNGIWFDIGNEAATVSQCFIADNDDAGIFYEISYGLHAHDNVIVGNGYAPTRGAWGAQAGISLSSSPNCIVERNLIYGNREGLNFREQKRSTPTIDDRASRPVWNHDQLVRNNILASNRDAQVWGWFDVQDQRHWPAAQQRDADGGPPELNLEKLHLRFEGNVYGVGPGDGGFKWGTAWGRHQYFANLEEFQTALGIDTGSRMSNPDFADPVALDFRLAPEVLAGLKTCYPQGPVPGVLLSVAP